MRTVDAKRKEILYVTIYRRASNGSMLIVVSLLWCAEVNHSAHRTETHNVFSGEHIMAKLVVSGTGMKLCTALCSESFNF
jgi:hypothetical protein